MTTANFGLLQPVDVGARFQQGLEFGKQKRMEQSTDDALRALVANPNDPNVVQDLAKSNPRAALQIQQQQQQQLASQRETEIKTRAAQGDPQAIAELAGIDWNAWTKLDGRSKQQLKQRTDYLGQAALAISQLPEQQRPQAWDAYAQQGVQQGYDDLAQYVGKYSPDALNGLIANAGQVKALLDLDKPDIGFVPDGATAYAQNAAGEDVLRALNGQPQVQQQPSPQGGPGITPPPENPDPSTPTVATTDQIAQVRQAFGGDETRTREYLARNNIVEEKTLNGKKFYNINGRWFDNPEGT